MDVTKEKEEFAEEIVVNSSLEEGKEGGDGEEKFEEEIVNASGNFLCIVYFCFIFILFEG